MNFPKPLKRLIFLKVLLASLLLAHKAPLAKQSPTPSPSPSEKAVVVVVDTGLHLSDMRFAPYLCKEGHRDFTGTGIEDYHGHGTHIASLIIANAKKANYCLVIFKYENAGSTPEDNVPPYKEALKALVLLKPQFVNMSLSGNTNIPVEESTISFLKDTTFVVAAGNESSSYQTQPRWPAMLSFKYNNVVVVGSLDKDGNKLEDSNWGYKDMVWEYGENILGLRRGDGTIRMSGTSMATAITTGKLINRIGY
jgi:subtilisin family serine protease